MRDLQNWRKSEYGYDENTDVDQPENATVVLQQQVEGQFHQDIICSELLSRGWTYQEILLSPANLLCTRQMMWWSCSDASCSELFPENTPTLGHDINEPPVFMDPLRSEKVALKSGKSLINIWMDVISSYSRTSVTFRDDRVVAIAGIARLFSSWFPKLLDSADLTGHFHSGIWSTEVIQQLLWRCTSSRRTRCSRDDQIYIPSWSPLSSLSCHPSYNRSSTTVTLAEYVEIGSSGTTGVFRTDQFGRVQNQSEAVLHLRSVLVPIIVRSRNTGWIFQEEEQKEQQFEWEEYEPLSKVELRQALGHDYTEEDLHSEDYPGDEEDEDEEGEERILLKYSVVQLDYYSGLDLCDFCMNWDTLEDRARALSPSKINVVDLRALPCEVRQWDSLPDQFGIFGIILRPNYKSLNRTIKNDEIHHNSWVRCGSFECYVESQSAKAFAKAFDFKRYGWTVEVGFEDNRWKQEETYVHLARTGTAPDLDDVFIL